MSSVIDKQKWVKSAFHGYYRNKERLPDLKDTFDKISVPGFGGKYLNQPYVKSSAGNGVEKSILQYLFDRERIEKAISDCERKISLVEKTIQHFSIEEAAKGKKHRQYIEYRFIRGMSYTRAAIECGLRERTSDFVIDEIMTVAYAIAEMEGYI